ncbi:hypothetical protein BpHYR1_023431 [Brachionus plicatilis]|uniref:Uncharacterized protein n=1 Tax=Brachionus plicatilis TaxID=10195 RepID=A0A3M7P4W2_BRAPC|nr:hypothetical protein BpHYR1_023431 [Brachionus plicatilis]
MLKLCFFRLKVFSSLSKSNRSTISSIHEQDILLQQNQLFKKDPEWAKLRNLSLFLVNLLLMD